MPPLSLSLFPMAAGLPSPRNSLRQGGWRQQCHFMRPDTSLPFDKGVLLDSGDMVSEVKRSFSRYEDKDVLEGLQRGQRLKTALKMEGEHSMSTQMA